MSKLREQWEIVIDHYIKHGDKEAAYAFGGYCKNESYAQLSRQAGYFFDKALIKARIKELKPDSARYVCEFVEDISSENFEFSTTSTAKFLYIKCNGDAIGVLKGKHITSLRDWLNFIISQEQSQTANS